MGDFDSTAPDWVKDPSVGANRIARRFLGGVILAVWAVATIVIVLVPRSPVVLLVIAFGLANTVCGLLLMRQLRKPRKGSSEN